MPSLSGLSLYANVIGFLIGLPTVVGTYYQSWRARQESRLAREGLVYSENCLEFILENGDSINLVPLETLHTLPKTGDIVLLPGSSSNDLKEPQHAAYRVTRIEYIYTRVESRHSHHGQARLVKAVAHVDRLS